jgi:hypothetical protein
MKNIRYVRQVITQVSSRIPSVVLIAVVVAPTSHRRSRSRFASTPSPRSESCPPSTHFSISADRSLYEGRETFRRLRVSSLTVQKGSSRPHSPALSKSDRRSPAPPLTAATMSFVKTPTSSLTGEPTNDFSLLRLFIMLC